MLLTMAVWSVCVAASIACVALLKKIVRVEQSRHAQQLKEIEQLYESKRASILNQYVSMWMPEYVQNGGNPKVLLAARSLEEAFVIARSARSKQSKRRSQERVAIPVVFSEKEVAAAALLGISVGSPPAKVRAAYTKLAFAHHPDRGGDPEVLVHLNSAKSTLERLWNRNHDSDLDLN